MLAYAFYENDTRVMQYATALAERGDLVDVIALRRKGLPEHEVLSEVNVYRIQERMVNERGRLAHLYRILRFLLLAAIVLTRKHLAQRYQLIHVHSVPDFLVFAAAVPKLFGTPIILDIHDVLPEFYASKFHVNRDSLLFKLILLVERYSFAFSDHVIVANHLWRQRLISRSIMPEKCTAICNYPDPQIFYPRPRHTTNHKFVIIYPGTLNWHQGLDVAIKAFARVKDQIPEAEFHIYGEGPAKPCLIGLANKLGLNGKVVFHDFLPTAQIAEVMANSDLAVEPKRSSSLFGNEALSTKILEFMALGIPLVVSRTKTHAFYYNDSTVKFFDSDSEEDLAACILLLNRDPQLRNQLALNAARYVQSNNWEVKREEYLDLTDSLTAAQRMDR